MHRRGHIEHTLRQLHPAAGALVDNLIQQFQDEIVRVPGLQYLQLAHVQIPPGGVRLFVQTLDDGGYAAALGPHVGLVLEDQKEAMPDGVAGYPLADLRDIVLDHLPAGFVLLLFGKTLHPLHVVGGIRRGGPGLQLEIVRGDFQPGGVLLPLKVLAIWNTGAGKRKQNGKNFWKSWTRLSHGRNGYRWSSPTIQPGNAAVRRLR